MQRIRQSRYRITIIYQNQERDIIFTEQFIISRVNVINFFQSSKIIEFNKMLPPAPIYSRKQIGYIDHRFSVYFIMLQNIKAYTHRTSIHKSTDCCTNTCNIYHSAYPSYGKASIDSTIFHFRIE